MIGLGAAFLPSRCANALEAAQRAIEPTPNFGCMRPSAVPAKPVSIPSSPAFFVAGAGSGALRPNMNLPTAKPTPVNASSVLGEATVSRRLFVQSTIALSSAMRSAAIRVSISEISESSSCRDSFLLRS